MIVGIVGAEAAKFTVSGREEARAIIRDLLARDGARACSGHCHLGGVDIWTEEIARELGIEPLVFAPTRLSWEAGYKLRNIQIAEASDEVHCIAVRRLPAAYAGMRFKLCYHCGRTDHVKGGGCWTAKYAQRLGKTTTLHIVENAEPTP